MSVRLHQITQKLASLNAKFDAVHTNNQQLMDKIREKLDETDAEEMEANREFDDLRRKVIIVKRQKRGIGLLRSVWMKLYDYGIYLLSCVGLHEPVKKPSIRETKRCKNIPCVKKQHGQANAAFQTSLPFWARPNFGVPNDEKPGCGLEPN